MTSRNLLPSAAVGLSQALLGREPDTAEMEAAFQSLQAAYDAGSNATIANYINERLGQVCNEAAVGIAVRTFAHAILHGDEQHQQWLKDAAEAFIAARPLPPPTSDGADQ